MSDSGQASSSQAGEDRPSSLYEQAYPQALKDQERQLFQARRVLAGVEPDSGRVGCGLSGGGIRSATFCLGAFQGMARQGEVLRRIDFLSTVSGGGYFGTFFGRLLGRDYVKGQGREAPQYVEQVLKAEAKPEVLNYLRENGRYLAPNGAGDSLLAGAVLLRNWVSIHIVLIVFLLGVFLALQVARVGLEQVRGLSDALKDWVAGGIWWSPFLILPAITFALGAFPIGWAYWLIEPESRAIEKAGKAMQPADPGREPARRWRTTLPPWTGFVLVWVASAWLTFATRSVPVAWLWGLVTTVTTATFIWWQIAKRRKVPEEEEFLPQAGDKSGTKELFRDTAIRHRLGLWVTWWLTTSAALLALALIDSLGQTLYVVLQRHEGLGVWLTGVFSSWTVVATFARRIAVFFSKGPGAKRPSLPLQWIATAAALVVVALLLVSLDAAAHGIAWSFVKKPPGAPPSLVEAKEGKAVSVEVRGERPLSLKLEAGTGGDSQGGKGTGDSGAEAAERPDPGPAILGLALAFLLSICFGQTWSFVNNSSHQQMYSSRLTRAYLGASNSNRWRGDGRSVIDALPGDDSTLADYWPPPAEWTGLPIHLINVTINETIDGRSQVQQQDRKGNGMALGPCGLSVNAQHHLLLPFGDREETYPVGAPVEIYPRKESNKDVFRVFEYGESGGKPRFTGEMLALGSWVGISGAAFSTGTGAQTNLGLSLLAGLGNVRLGRWWDSGIIRPPTPHGKRKFSLRIEDFLARVFPVQVYLLDEFLARFPGTARRHWYLSDGGHFENMGGYELIRRRLPMIVIIDAEEDENYTFGGLSNLVRKARLDFGAEIRFLSEAELDEEVDESVRRHFGTLEQLRRGSQKDGELVESDPSGLSRAHAALAFVTYTSPESTTPSLLLYIKPTLTGDEPMDVLEYHKAHPNFPHESTLDQIFDEAQWESYRRLGEHIAEKLFVKPEESRPGLLGKIFGLEEKPRRWQPWLLADRMEDPDVKRS